MKIPTPQATPSAMPLSNHSSGASAGAPLTQHTIIAGDRIERALKAERTNEPGADVLFARAHDAVWDAFYMRGDDGFDVGVGPKRPAQMAFIIKRDLDASLASRGVSFHADRDPNAARGFRVTGRDRDGNGVDISISAKDEVHVAPVELGFVAQALVTDWRWQPNPSVSSHLEMHNEHWPAGAWVPEPKPNAMTGRE